MRLALTNDVHANGGAMSLMAVRYVRALNEAGHHCTLITGKRDQPLPTDIPVESFAYPPRKPGLLAALGFAAELRRRSGEAFANWIARAKAEGTPPDGWLAMVPPSADGAMRGGGADLPLLYVCNSPWVMEWDAAYEIGHGRPAPFWRRLPAVLPRRRIERAVVSHARGLTSLSQLQLDWLYSEHPAARNIPSRVIPGAVDCTEITPLSRPERSHAKHAICSELGVDPAQPLLICSRRLVQRTGVDLLIDAHARMKTLSTLVITGNGPAMPSLKTQAAASARSGHIFFRGFVPWEELKRLTAAADVAVLPTRALEGFGLSAAEALAAGTPVVATPVTALVEVVGGLNSNLLAERVDATALAEALDRVVSMDSEASSRLRQRCRDYALRYDWSRLKADFVEWAEKCLGVSR